MNAPTKILIDIIKTEIKELHIDEDRKHKLMKRIDHLGESISSRDIFIEFLKDKIKTFTGERKLLETIITCPGIHLKENIEKAKRIIAKAKS
jgi:hypothetical protein